MNKAIRIQLTSLVEAQQINLPHSSSSKPSRQSGLPSHLCLWSIQLPSRHVNWLWAHVVSPATNNDDNSAAMPSVIARNSSDTFFLPSKANSAFHTSGVGKWVPALAGKANAAMAHSVSRWTRGVQVKLWDPLRTRAIPERLRGVFTTKRYTNSRLPLPLPYLPPFLLSSSFSYKKLIRRWDSERELSLRRHCTRSKNTIDSCINSATDRFLQHRFTKFREITQCNGHYAVQGHSRSPTLVPVESAYTTSY